MESKGLKFDGVSKYFDSKCALDKVDLFIEQGTVHAIIGENGAGKSTLMNILVGIHQATEGELYLNGELMNIKKPNDAADYGIGMVHQHFMLVNELKVWQNISLGIEKLHHCGMVDEKTIRKDIQEVCDKFHFSFDMDEIVGNLPVGEQQRIEIIKVLHRRAEYIVLDEPTAVLTSDEVDRLFENIEEFRKAGKTVIFISHKIDEVLRISDRITVMRKGQLVGTLERDEADRDRLVEMMVGRNVDLEKAPLKCETGKELLRMDKVEVSARGFSCGLHDISLSLREGEILGIAGVDGNGQSELVEAIMGMSEIVKGSVFLSDENVTKSSVKRNRSLGVSCIPPDRHSQGMVLDNNLTRNMVMGLEGDKRFGKGPFLSKKLMDDKTEELLSSYDVRYGSIAQTARELSGGNQQKVILARECGLIDPKVLVAANPTRGLDIGAIEYVYEILEKLKSKGVGIVLISTELSEILRLSDRIAVLYNGRIMGIIPNENVDTVRLGHMMVGRQEMGGESDV